MDKTKYELVVVGDENDYDLITEFNTVTMEEIVRIIPIAEVIKNCKEHYNWPYCEYGAKTVQELYPGMEDEIEWFNEMYAPYAEHGIHTIKSITYYPLPNKVILL